MKTALLLRPPVMARRPLLGLVVAVLLTLPLAGRVTAAAGETIVGRVANGTRDALLPSGLSVTLQGVGPSHQVVVKRVARTDASGHFRFDDLPSDSNLTYVVSTEYAGVPYLAAVPKAGDQSTVHTKLTVYEPTTSDASIRLDSANWLLGSVDVEKQQATILAMLVVSNDSDRVYVGDHRGDPGSAMPGVLPRTLRLTLPAGASGFRPQLGLDPSTLLPVANGYVDTAPVLPGRHDVVYTYQIGYADGVAELQSTLPYPTTRLHFLAPDVGLGFRSDHLRDGGTTQLDGHQYRVLTADNLKADTTVTVDVIGLPAVATNRLDPGAMRTSGLVLIALAVIVALVAGLRSGARQPAGPAALLTEQRGLLTALARLDEQYAAGEIGLEHYQAERARQKQRLIDLSVGVRTASGPGVS